MTTNFASGFRAGVEAAKEALEDLAVRAKTALRIRCDRCGTTYIEGERHGCAQQPDAAPSIGDLPSHAKRLVSDAADRIVDEAERKGMLDAPASPVIAAWQALEPADRLTVEQELRQFPRAEFKAALALLRALAPEAGDDR